MHEIGSLIPTHRHHTGVGQRVDCSLMDTQLACLVNIGQNWLLGATTQAKRWSVCRAFVDCLGPNTLFS